MRIGLGVFSANKGLILARDAIAVAAHIVMKRRRYTTAATFLSFPPKSRNLSLK
jgi:hypothetical protein